MADNSNPPQFAAQFDNPPSGPAPSSDQPVKLPSAFSLFQPSSQLAQKNLSAFLIVVLLPGAYFGVIQEFFNSKTAGHHVALWVGLFAIGVIYNLVILAARPLLELRSVQGKKPGFGETLEASWPYFLRLVGLTIVISFLILIGILLLIVPGLIMIRRYYLASYFLIDQNLGIQEAMRRSADATKGHSGAVWGLIGVQILLSVPRWIPFIGFIIVAIMNMLYACAPALRYEEFKALSSPPAKDISLPPNPVGN